MGLSNPYLEMPGIHLDTHHKHHIYPATELQPLFVQFHRPFVMGQMQSFHFPPVNLPVNKDLQWKPFQVPPSNDPRQEIHEKIALSTEPQVCHPKTCLLY